VKPARLIVVAVALLLVWSCHAASVVRVTAVNGFVEHYTPSAKKWARTKLGAQLPAGSKVRTGKRSAVELTFPDGTRYRLGASSQMTIQAFRPSQVALARGGLFARVIKGSAVRLKGRYGTVAVRGTQVAYEIVGDREYVQVWDGAAQYETPQGIMELPASTGAWVLAGGQPTKVGNIAPERFAGGHLQPWWEDLRTGVRVRATGANPATRRAKLRRIIQDKKLSEAAPGQVAIRDRTGVIEVEIESAAAQAGAEALSGGTSASLLGLSLASALSTQGMNMGRALGRKVWGPYGTAQAYGLWGEGGSFFGARARARMIVDGTMLQVSGRFDSMTGEDPNFLLDETFAAWKNDTWQVMAGRSRVLQGPVNNTDYGTLMPWNLADGVQASAWVSPRTSLTVAWLEDFDSIFEDDQKGWYGRVSTYVGGGNLSVAALHQNSHGTGVVGQATFPVVGDCVDAYAEFGDDPDGQHLETVGLTFPSLYQKYGLELYLERAQRHGLDTLTSLNAYWEVRDDWQVVGVVDHSRDEGWRVGLGFIASFGN